MGQTNQLGTGLKLGQTTQPSSQAGGGLQLGGGAGLQLGGGAGLQLGSGVKVGQLGQTSQTATSGKSKVRWYGFGSR